MPRKRKNTPPPTGNAPQRGRGSRPVVRRANDADVTGGAGPMLRGPTASGMSPSTTQSAGSVPVQTGQEHVVIPPSFRDVLPGSAQGAIPGSTHDAMRGSTQGTTPVSTLGVIQGSTQNIQYDQQSLVDSITAKVLQAIQSECQPLAFNTQSTTSTGVADAIAVPEVTTVDTAQMVSDALQTWISGDRGEAAIHLGSLLMAPY